MANYVEILRSLLFSPEEQQKYAEDPGYLADKGIPDDAPPAQIQEAVAMAYEKGPPEGIDAPPVAAMPPPPENAPLTAQDAVKHYVDSAHQPPAEVDHRDPYVADTNKADYEEDETPLDDPAMVPDHAPADDYDPNYGGEEPKFGEGDHQQEGGYPPGQQPQPEYQPEGGHQPDYQQPPQDYQPEGEHYPEPEADHQPEDDHGAQPDYDPQPEGDPHYQPEPDLDPAG